MSTITISFIIGLTATIVSVCLAVAEYVIRKRPAAMRRKQETDRVEESFKQLLDSMDALYPSEIINRYRDHMINDQPFHNSRILSGSGKNHTLNLLADVSEQDQSVLSVLDCVGDAFS